MKILLDENLPLPLYRRLREAGYDAEHVIALGKPDAELRRRLAAEPILERESPHKLFDLLPDGQIVAWEIRQSGRVRVSPPGEG